MATPDDRRSFLAQAVALVLGTVSLATPVVMGIVTLLNPLRMKGRAGQFMQLATLDTLPEDGTPQKIPVVADRTDAWNVFPNEPIGAVYLRRVGPKEVQALQVVCPHAGCIVGYQPTPEGGKFFCPCHAASFDLTGKRTDKKSHSPRDLDTLEVKLGEHGEVLVNFESFETGTSRKVAKA